MLRRDVLLVVGLALAPMTGLRVWKVGPAEFTLLLWAILELPALVRLRWNSLQVVFWVAFLALAVLGTAVGAVLYPAESDPFGLSTYFYLMFISLAVYAGLHRRSLREVEALMTLSAVVATILFTVLLAYSYYVSPFIGSIPLTYADLRFSGGADNPHQLAVLMGATLFIHYRSFIRARSLRARFVWLFAAVCALLIGAATRSSTLVMAVGLTALIGALTSPSIRIADQRGRWLVSLWLTALVVVVVALFNDMLLSVVWQWIESDPNGLGRLSIFSSIGESLDKSALVGLGPGIHALGGTMEYHNTYLEILAMSGLGGLSLFAWYAYRQFRTVSIDRTLVMVVAPLYLYGLAGFAMRRLPYWVITMTVVVLAEKMRECARHSALVRVSNHEDRWTSPLHLRPVGE